MEKYQKQSDVIVDIATFVEEEDWDTVLPLCLNLAQMSFEEGYRVAMKLSDLLRQDATS